MLEASIEILEKNCIKFETIKFEHTLNATIIRFHKMTVEMIIAREIIKICIVPIKSTSREKSTSSFLANGVTFQERYFHKMMTLNLPKYKQAHQKPFGHISVTPDIKYSHFK